MSFDPRYLTMYDFLKTYARWVLVSGSVVQLALLLQKGVGLLLGIETSPKSEPERAYEDSQRQGIDLDKQDANLYLANEAAIQHRELEGQPLPSDRDSNLKQQDRVEEIQLRLRELVPLETSLVNPEPAQALEIVELQEEMLKLQQERGTLVTKGEDPFLPIKIGKLMLSNMTNDNRLPVSVGVEFVDLLVESGDIDGAAQIYMATQRAMENGDEFFKPERWTERAAHEQGGSENSVVTIDPCCPAEATLPHLEESRGPESTTVKTPTLPTIESIETQHGNRLSLERFDKARQLIDEYGTEEGLRRLKESDPDAARRFERAPREQKMNTEP